MVQYDCKYLSQVQEIICINTQHRILVVPELETGLNGKGSLIITPIKPLEHNRPEVTEKSVCTVVPRMPGSQ